MVSKRIVFSCVSFITLLFCLWVGVPSAHARDYAQLNFYNSDHVLLGHYDGADLTLPWSREIIVQVSDVSSQTGKMRLKAGDCASWSQDDESAPFEFKLEPPSANSRCLLQLEGWKARGWNWLGKETFRLRFNGSSTAPSSDEEEPQPSSPSRPSRTSERPQRPTVSPSSTSVSRNFSSSSSSPSSSRRSTLYRITQGTGGRTSMAGSSSTRSGHGVRIYCPPSHFAHDDPVIFPNQPGRSHLHIFIGNTEAKASSTPSSLLRGGNSTCEGGVNVRSSYWTPAVMSNGQPVIPASSWIYYKTFMANDNFGDLQIVPNGLQMLASASTRGYRNQLKVEKNVRNSHTGKQSIKLTAVFPNCIATKNGRWNGEPILDYRDMPGQASRTVNSHVAYAEGNGNLNHLGCPTTHPYRIPTMSIHQYYHHEDLRSGWKLASDIERGTSAGATFHADYIAAWDNSTMRFITDCNRFAQDCEFNGRRSQLSERLSSPGGRQLYESSHIVSSSTDMTPFGNIPAKL